jgi:hypothetical protein
MKKLIDRLEERTSGSTRIQLDDVSESFKIKTKSGDDYGGSVDPKIFSEDLNNMAEDLYTVRGYLRGITKILRNLKNGYPSAMNFLADHAKEYAIVDRSVKSSYDLDSSIGEAARDMEVLARDIKKIKR